MGQSLRLVESPVGSEMDQLCAQIRECQLQPLRSDSDRQSESALSESAQSESTETLWPTRQLELLSKTGVYRWFAPRSVGGWQWSSQDIVEGYIRLSSACLTTTFILTQRVAALKRICNSPNTELRDRLMPGLLSGEQPATVGISHLTTSRQHTGRPALRAVRAMTSDGDGFEVDGLSPWVTGGCAAKWLLMGAQLDDGQQILFVVTTDREGITIDPGFKLVGLTASQTGAVKCNSILIPPSDIVAGPRENVLSSLSKNSTGGFQTSSLALGLSKSAIQFLGQQSLDRPTLSEKFESLQEQYDRIESQLKQLAAGFGDCTNEELRSQANSLVLRATQSALVAAKGSGYVEGHPVGRWCQEALFFLVWSCPQAVLDANLCELVGIES